MSFGTRRSSKGLTTKTFHCGLQPKKIVRAGYDKISSEYTASRRRDSQDILLLKELLERLPDNSTILDVGCGSGDPVTILLAQRSTVIGIDFSNVQIRTAKQRVPQADFVCGDIASLPVREKSLDAICSYYAIIHVPREEHDRILHSLWSILKPKGLALVCLGAGDLPEDLSQYHDVPMFWSHYDDETNVQMMSKAGFRVLWAKRVVDSTDPQSIHLFVLAKKNEE